MANVSSRLARASLVALALSIAGAVGPAFANPSGGSGSTGGGTPSCKPGYVYDANTKTCIKANSGLLDDEQLYQQGRALALDGHYEEALGALAAVQNQNDSRVLTMIGYAKRKLGNFDEGVAYYQQALAIDPDNADTRDISARPMSRRVGWILPRPSSPTSRLSAAPSASSTRTSPLRSPDSRTSRPGVCRHAPLAHCGERRCSRR